jgi:hypothetical protein
MTTTITKTIPSAVLGQYLSDVQAFWDFTEPSAYKRDTRELPIKRGLAPNLSALYGREVAESYLDAILARAKAQRQTEARAKWERERGERRAAKVEPKRPESRPKAKRPARLCNERRMRDAILKVVRRHGWTSAGIRKLADLAGMKHRTARDTLDRMEADGQVELDRSWGQGKRTGVKVLLEHPCWSDPKHAQSLAQSKLSALLRP